MTHGQLTLCIDSRFVSPYALSAFVALQEKGLPFELQKINLQAKENYRPEHLKRSLTGRVPVLVHGEFSLSESSAIDEYLEDRFPGPQYPRLYPTDLEHKARARQLQAWLRSDLLPIRQERSTEVIFLKPNPQPLSTAAQAAVSSLFGVAEGLLSGTGEQLFGDWCIADTDLALMLNRLVLNGDEVPPRLAAYASKQWQRPSVQLWVEQARKGAGKPA
ncbi:MAG: glutathione S-transferase [Candidatus Lambdaproteobacteria bacterium RIFOXYD1_FULL_56_27]|uniref:Glutathione S-transferase n=1 Tax=Candidatus Lambdaproteobacteria bacterium RIFOXYD2_FULL_56_26 TaxID=1817773 RepID=A0A1F6H400_9PROT|nr:MAG: glutathione S-transferase [Candidatus Lambdaproteobacteria bacterium RIFOXYD2_FULL_56_26]OGH05343.1 MAG: glutathione S-transferase [Candidatus Lambdaproteobacteria bacterium RIFOXYC1_FULL_56_13]OGH09185.1 MAG: glutathione S-transferase [Candidatus Lambdaproteobacteria bacterium RIFOXYD1_FULL_56_27]